MTPRDHADEESKKKMVSRVLSSNQGNTVLCTRKEKTTQAMPKRARQGKKKKTIWGRVGERRKAPPLMQTIHTQNLGFNKNDTAVHPSPFINVPPHFSSFSPKPREYRDDFNRGSWNENGDCAVSHTYEKGERSFDRRSSGGVYDSLREREKDAL